MRYRKTLILCLATAGLAGWATAPQAQFANVFVPDLAVIDGALYRLPALAGMPLTRLAQATQAPRKKEISPAPPAVAQAASAPASAGEPPLMPGPCAASP